MGKTMGALGAKGAGWRAGLLWIDRKDFRGIEEGPVIRKPQRRRERRREEHGTDKGLLETYLGDSSFCGLQSENKIF